MAEFKTLMLIFVGVVFVNNFVLSRFLGLCPYLGVSRETKSALGMGAAVIFVMSIASVVTWFVYRYGLFLLPRWLFSKMGVAEGIGDLRFLRTIAFILVIATLVQFVEMVIRKVSPALYRSLGIYLPLITTNCAVLGVCILNVDRFFQGSTPLTFSLLRTLVQGLGAGVGFTLALLLMSGIRERLALVDVPPAFRGAPVAFLVAGLMSLGFLGFAGLVAP